MTGQPHEKYRLRRSLFRVGQFDAALPAGLICALWNAPESVVETGQPLRCKAARQTVLVAWGAERYVLKHYVEPTWRHTLKQLVLRSRARVTWAVAHKLVDAGVSTPRPVACVENRWGPLRRDSFLMYPYQDGRTLRALLEANAGGISSPLVEDVWRQIREMWQRLAVLRASLADTNVGNFIICPAGRLWVIDLDKARFHRTAGAAARQQTRGWKQLLRSVEIAKCSNATPQKIDGASSSCNECQRAA